MSLIIHLMNITFVVGPAMDHPENLPPTLLQEKKKLSIPIVTGQTMEPLTMEAGACGFCHF